MITEVLVREAVPGDAPELWRLNQAFNGPGEKTAEEMERDLKEPLAERVFVAQSGGKLAGFCCCQVKRSFCYETMAVEITELYVEPEYRGRGIGESLLLCVRRAFPGDAIEKLELLTGGDNLSARGFYEHLGFSPSGEVHYEQKSNG